LMTKWIGRNVRRNNPASAITNFLEIEENTILSIVHEIFTDLSVQKEIINYKNNCI
jgi:hypothetical protein